jgi:hypothetical protein
MLMYVDVLIDRLTPCLYKIATGELMQTVFSVTQTEELINLQKKGWNFNWHSVGIDPKLNVYKLLVKGDEAIQGLVATEVNKNAVYVSLAESAPHNLGKNKEYDGVGGHLFAIAIKLSFALGFGGFIYMDAKNMELVKHYHEKLGAERIYSRVHAYRMEISEENAQKVLEKYTLEGDLNVE